MISGTMDCDSVIDRRLYADEDHFGRDNKDENIQRLENQAAFFVPGQAERSHTFLPAFYLQTVVDFTNPLLE